MVLVAPSILSADFTKLGEEIKAVERAGADWIHVDVMDGQFVQNLTMGPLVVHAVRQVTELPIDVHLMVISPERLIEDFAKAGATYMTVHGEACSQLPDVLKRIHRLGKKAGVALNPSTSVDHIQEVIHEIDLVLVMTVHPGFSGQSFIPEAAKKIAVLRQMLQAADNTTCFIEVDGGVSERTAPLLIQQGANVLVSGSFIFQTRDGDYHKAIQKLRT